MRLKWVENDDDGLVLPSIRNQLTVLETSNPKKAIINKFIFKVTVS
jgi:hypothetical protein